MNKLNRISGAIDWIKTEHIFKKSAAQTYDRIAKNARYDSIIDFETRQDALKKLMQDIDVSNKKILDIACGSGAFINAIIGKKPKKVIGVDVSSGMLDLARRRFKHYSNVDFIHNSFMNVTFDISSFDYILLANASRYIPGGREKEFFINIKKWLKPKGYFIILSDNVFGISFLGKLLANVFYRLANDSNTNPKTALEWNLKPELEKYFVIENTGAVGWAWHGKAKHTAYFCRN